MVAVGVAPAAKLFAATVILSILAAAATAVPFGSITSYSD